LIEQEQRVPLGPWGFVPLRNFVRDNTSLCYILAFVKPLMPRSIVGELEDLEISKK